MSVRENVAIKLVSTVSPWASSAIPLIEEVNMDISDAIVSPREQGHRFLQRMLVDTLIQPDESRINFRLS